MHLGIKLWPVIGVEFHQLIIDSIRNCALPQNMIKDLILLLHKGGSTNELTNYRPITVFNVLYKILTKALQKRLQLLLWDLIDEDQTIFYP